MTTDLHLRHKRARFQSHLKDKIEDSSFSVTSGIVGSTVFHYYSKPEQHNSVAQLCDDEQPLMTDGITVSAGGYTESCVLSTDEKERGRKVNVKGRIGHLNRKSRELVFLKDSHNCQGQVKRHLQLSCCLENIFQCT